MKIKKGLKTIICPASEVAYMKAKGWKEVKSKEVSSEPGGKAKKATS